MKVRISTLEENIRKANDDLKAETDALSYIVNEARTARRAKYLHDLNVSKKSQKLLTSWGMSCSLSSSIAKMLWNCTVNKDSDDVMELCDFEVQRYHFDNATMKLVIENPEPADFDHAKPALWNESHDFVKGFRDMLFQLSPGYEDRTAELEAGFNANPKLFAARYHMGSVKTGWSWRGYAHEDALDFVTADAAAPWICGTVRGAFSPGPETWPLPGLPQFLVFPDAEAHMTLMLVPAACIVRQGITLSTLWTFASETAEGKRLWCNPHDGIIFMNVAPGDVVFVPAGMISMPVFFGVSTKAEIMSAAVVHHTVFSKSWMMELDAAVFRAVRRYNDTAFEKRTSDKWKARKTFMGEFWKTCVPEGEDSQKSTA